MNVLVVYWSGTGNTKAMAEAVAEGAKSAGAEVSLTEVGSVDAGVVDAYERIAFGCPSMGAEVLEESEFEPFFTNVEGKLGGKKVALFGSYGWGDGEWMRDWYKRTDQTGALLCGDEGLIVNETPDSSGISACQDLGKTLAAM